MLGKCFLQLDQLVMTSALRAWDCSNQQTPVRCDRCVAFFGYHSQHFILFLLTLH